MYIRGDGDVHKLVREAWFIRAPKRRIPERRKMFVASLALVYPYLQLHIKKRKSIDKLLSLNIILLFSICS
jgi:hypothetical protein